MSVASRRPRVTVLMPVHNAATFLREAIDSVLGQSWTDFELLIVDDGSSDGSGAMADQYAAAEPRVRVEHVAHRGLVPALNLGLDTIETELIARADADDVNRPDRLARQIAFLDARPDIGVCGSWVEAFPRREVCNKPEHWDALRATLLCTAPVLNPTVLMRRHWIAHGGCRFDPAFVHAEDYDFWERAAHVTRFANISMTLVRYRRHPGQVSVTQGTTQWSASQAVRRRQLLALGMRPTADELALHGDVAAAACGVTRERLEQARCWLERLSDANRSAGCYPEPAFAQILALQWYRNCAEAVSRGHPAAGAFARSPLAAALPDAWWYAIRLRVLRVLPTRLTRRAVQWRLHRRAQRGAMLECSARDG